MKVYGYQEMISDHHAMFDTIKVVITATKPVGKVYQEFEVEKLSDVFFDGEKIKVKAKAF